MQVATHQPVWAHRRSGQALVESAFVLPLLLVVMIGVFELGRLLFTYAALTNGARELGRALAISSTSNASAIDAFNKAVFLPVANPATDKLTMNVYSAGGTLLASQSGACTLPVAAGTCTVPARSAASKSGWVDVSVSYRFTFAGWFQGPQGAAFTVPPIALLSSTRVLIE
jgi:Flp pilus assembly protein TadG